jgi:hypothetical protein
MKGSVVALSCAGDITILESETLETKSNWPSPSNGSSVQYAWLLSMAHSNLQARTFMIVLYSGPPNTTHLRVQTIDETDSISQIKDEDIELPVEVILRRSHCYRNLLILDNRKSSAYLAIPQVT